MESVSDKTMKAFAGHYIIGWTSFCSVFKPVRFQKSDSIKVFYPSVYVIRKINIGVRCHQTSVKFYTFNEDIWLEPV